MKQPAADFKLEPTRSTLKAYTGHDLQVKGPVQVVVRYNSKQLPFSLHVVAGLGPNLLGRDLITPLDVQLDNLKGISSFDLTSPVEDVLDAYALVFSDQLGCYNGPIQLKIDFNAEPKFYKPKSVPVALRNKVDAELQFLQSQGIISPVKHSSWTAPIRAVGRGGKRGNCPTFSKLTI